MTNTNVGNTRSVAVRPFHAAWFMKPHEPLPPLLLTMIMNAIVIPRATSRDSGRRAGSSRVADVLMTIGALCSNRLRAWHQGPEHLVDEDAGKGGRDEIGSGADVGHGAT